MKTLDISYYIFENQDGELVCPFLDYMGKYNPSIEKDIKHIANIESHIDHVAQRGGNYNLPNRTEEYAPDIGVIKIKSGKELIRLAFVTVVDDKMVILNAMEKPNKYGGKKKLIIDSEIRKFVDQAIAYRLDYLEKRACIPKDFTQKDLRM